MEPVWLEEVCDSCGKPVKYGWAATDEHWDKVVGRHEGHRCMACFTEESAAKGITCTWWARDADAEEEREYAARRAAQSASTRPRGLGPRKP